ncbi:MAG: carboxypeptidase regulatory-like domain-containing protein [Bacteroidia bacterium]|nr:carboxypeptidase regulatory-like domain-containing protein [Bacteroidia bacterium]
MLRKIYLSIVTLLLVGTSVNAQNGGGAIKVLLKDKTNGETIPFANVVAYQGGVQVGVGTTDMDGYATIKPLAPGKYDVKGVYVGYQAQEIKGIVVGESKTAYVTIELSNGEGVRLDEVEVIAYQEPLIDGDMKSGGTVTREEYQNMATKNINSVAATTAGVYQADEGGALNVRGGRSNSTIYFVDGVKVIGGLGVPQQGVEQLNVITGGVPAQYGDATSGIISVTTRGPQSKFFGGVELISSQLTDKYGYNSLGFSVGGPIYQKRDSTGQKKPVIGFFLSGQGTYEKDPDPSYVKLWKLNDEKLTELEKNPLRVVTIGSEDKFYRELDYVTKTDMSQISVRQNVANRSVQLNGKLDFKLAPNTNLTIGGAFDYGNRHDFVYTYLLFNAQNNPQTIQSTWRTYARINQKFGANQTGLEKEKSQALISNAYFTFLASYEKAKSKTQDDTHKDKIFNYGYQGKYNFTVDTTSNYQIKYDELNNQLYLDYQGPVRGPVSYERSELNPTTANFSSQVFNFKGTEESIQAAQGDYAFVNGDRPQGINSLFASTGRQYNGYSVSESTQLRFASSFSADFKNHAIMVGVEYDQRNQSGYSISPIGLWERMRNLTNSHLQTFDTANPIFIAGTGGNLDQRYYRYVYSATLQNQIDKSLRESLGLSADNQTIINTDAFSPDDLKLDMFSAQDLLQSGQGALVDYYGFDYLGNKNNNSTNIDKFMNDKDKNGNQTLNVGAYKPIYVSGYIQDKFDFKDIKFNVGVRIDRFDANQKVLKDPYLFQEAYTAGEKSESKPENIKEDYVVYVDNVKATNPTIVGYRYYDEKTNTNTWYNSEGKEVSDPKLLAVDGKLNPWLKDADFADKNAFSTTAFKDYKPQINVMPRVAFSFPISDVANFFAHYDVLTQRPSDGLMRFDPKDYYFINSTSSSPFITNSNLRPEKTIDYEIGYNQVLNQKKNAALKITAFYRELRNQISLISLSNAYPKTYQTYTNKDFGTVKGLTAEFDLRRTGGISLTANYTLQFAEGSGSNANSGANLVNSDQPNLRITLPLNYDQRHTITINLDYRFGDGKDYKGPQFNRKKKDAVQTVQVFQNVGANLIFRIGSGTPYTRDIAASPIDAGSQTSSRSSINGSINGSYKPWQFRTDLRIDKNIELTWGKKDSENKKTANLNIYLQVLNLLNSKNILNVYNYTGNADDDGYLSSTQGQLSVNSNPDVAASFTDQYTIFINNPNNYSRPRTIRIGVLLDF